MLTRRFRLSIESAQRIRFVGNIVGEKRSLTISEGTLLRLTAADHNRTLADGTGLSGKVHAGKARISVHFRYRYRFEGHDREMPLGAWPRDTLDAIRTKFEEAKLRVGRATRTYPGGGQGKD